MAFCEEIWYLEENTTAHDNIHCVDTDVYESSFWFMWLQNEKAQDQKIERYSKQELQWRQSRKKRRYVLWNRVDGIVSRLSFGWSRHLAAACGRIQIKRWTVYKSHEVRYCRRVNGNISHFIFTSQIVNKHSALMEMNREKVCTVVPWLLPYVRK